MKIIDRTDVNDPTRREGFWTYKVNLFISQRLNLSDFILLLPYSFLKSGKHMIQTQNLVHWYFVRRMKLNVWYGTAF